MSIYDFNRIEINTLHITATMLQEILKPINSDWKEFLIDEASGLRQKFTSALNELGRIADVNTITPALPDIMRAFSYSSPTNVRVVIIGQDPYPNADGPVLHADGLCFSSRAKTTPPSLRNIFACLARHYFIGEKYIADGTVLNTLDHWAEQNVLMLNTKLTTIRGQTNKHAWWLPFTTAIIKRLSETRAKVPLIFMLWGADAQSFEEHIGHHHHIMKWAHPSPQAQLRLPDIAKFINCDHFTEANRIIIAYGGAPIQWSPIVKLQMYLAVPDGVASADSRWALVVPDILFEIVRPGTITDAIKFVKKLVSRVPVCACVNTVGGLYIPSDDAMIRSYVVPASHGPLAHAYEIQKNGT